MWHTVARRPVRPMGTVVLNAKEKHEVLTDVNEYLHPSTPRWYASRGIPLRRGYLFHGPPGTGKTSFSFALAGVFGLDIYVISLQDINVTEEDLAVLFTKLPRRCIVLLEDIDTAGLQRDSADDDDKEDKKTTDEKEKKEDEKEKKEDDDKEKQVNGEVNGVAAAKVNSKVNGEVNGVVKEDTKDKDTKDTKDKKSKRSKKKKHDSSSESDSDSSSSEEDRKKRRKRSRRDRASLRRGMRDTAIMKPESISLSGLLNAIDGVASHEGRVLIMTTNKPESLDDALIRPGRVDLQVAFQNATSEQAGELFRRMYEGSRARVTKVAKGQQQRRRRQGRQDGAGGGEGQRGPRQQLRDGEPDRRGAARHGGRVFAPDATGDVLARRDPGVPAEAQEESAAGAGRRQGVDRGDDEAEGDKVQDRDGAVEQWGGRRGAIGGKTRGVH